ncbi:MAG: DUF1656 domain-containing protein [Gammaproteobacteria bacterium]|nr:DUF1656 domain-containing protein [Gammaproteobacteria bacterium]
MGSESLIPTEVDLTGLYFVPLLINFGLAIILTFVTAFLLNHYRLSRYFMFPHLVMAAMATIYTVLLSLWVIPA